MGGAGDELEDIDDALVDAEVLKAYDNQSLSASAFDGQSQASANKSRKSGGGNGNPNGLPGIPGGPGRVRAANALIEKSHSIGSAGGSGVHIDRGSSSLILDDGADYSND